MTKEEDEAQKKKEEYIQEKGAYKMLVGAVIVVLSPVITIFTATPAAFVVAGGLGLIGCALLAKTVERATRPKTEQPINSGMTFNKAANFASKYLGEYGTKIALVGIALTAPLVTGIALMIEGSGNILSGKDTMGIIPVIQYASKKVGGAFEEKAKEAPQLMTKVNPAKTAVPDKSHEIPAEVEKEAKAALTNQARPSIVERLFGSSKPNNPRQL